MLNFIGQQRQSDKADRVFCAEMRRVYGPLNFEKPPSLECHHETDENTKNCEDPTEYDTKCETEPDDLVYNIRLSPPQNEANGQRVPNIVILGKYKFR